MRIKSFIRTTLFLFLLSATIHVHSQEINIIPPTDMNKTFEGGEYEARIDFISNTPDLCIEENNGTPGTSPVQRADGQYVYTFICDVADTNKFGFLVSLKGGVSSQNLTVVVNEKDFREYLIETEEIPASIGEIKIDNTQVVVPKENTAMATITSLYPKLIIQSVTGEKAEGPTYIEGKKLFSYTVTFDMSTPASKETKRSLKLSVDNKNFTEQELGVLSPKQGVDLSVIVIQESCYRSNISQARNCFLNGAYKEAWDIYKKILETDECTDKPQNTSDDHEKMKDIQLLAAAFIRSKQYYEKAVAFEAEDKQDSCMYYHNEANKYRNFILKSNPSDPYCLEHNRIFERYKDHAPRIVSGQLVNNARMDKEGRNLPVEGVFVILSIHEKETKKVNGVSIPWYGKEVSTDRRKNLGQSDADGRFKVSVPRNSPGEVYVLNFTTDENFGNKSYKFIYMPKDVDIERNLYIKISPTGVNKYNQ